MKNYLIRNTAKPKLDENLTTDQAEYFKDSVIRDKLGNLLKVYHGTRKYFETFDPAMVGRVNGDQYGAGFNFTDSREVAERYAKKSINDGYIFECYLNITNPLSSDEVTLSDERITDIFSKTCSSLEKMAYSSMDSADMKNSCAKLLELTHEKGSGPMHTDVNVLDEINEAVTEFIYQPGNSEILNDIQAGLYEKFVDDNYERLIDEYGEDYEDAFSDYFGEQLIQSEIQSSIQKYSGHDGFVGTMYGGGNVYVALYPEQIKAADNLHPTYSPYINEKENDVFDKIFENRQIECDVEPSRNGIYQIDFKNPESLDAIDETEFTVSNKENAYMELKGLWEEFAKENDIPLDALSGIRCVGIDREIGQETELGIS